MTVLVTIPQRTHSDSEANAIFESIVHDFNGNASTHLSAFKNADYAQEGDEGLVNLGEFELPEPIDYDTYDTMKDRYEQQYGDVAITIESKDTYPIHNFEDINVEGASS